MFEKIILESAIDKAIAGGWKNDEGVTPIIVSNYIFLKKEYVAPSVLFDVKELIFDHDFAKALWGEELITWQDNELWDSHVFPAWKAHLMQMVIADDPIAYLGANL